jgi:GDP-L-fucose synthase
MRRQYGASFISAMPTNLYGPGDNFDLESSHVLPAMIRKFHDAMFDGRGEVELWGTGSPRREFLHVDDLAGAVVTLLERYDGPGPINIGVGEDVTIRELAETVRRVVGYRGAINWDASKPDGTPRKLLDISRIRSLGWNASIPLESGIESTYDWFKQHSTVLA